MNLAPSCARSWRYKARLRRTTCSRLGSRKRGLAPLLSHLTKTSVGRIPLLDRPRNGALSPLFLHLKIKLSGRAATAISFPVASMSRDAAVLSEQARGGKPSMKSRLFPPADRRLTPNPEMQSSDSLWEDCTRGRPDLVWGA